jgi:small subunit ribosomal protein S17
MATKKTEKTGAAKAVEKVKQTAEKAVARAEKVVGKASPAAAKAIGKAAHAVGLDTQAAAPKATPSTKEHAIHSFRRKVIGRITSDKMDKTVVVEASRYSRDPMYKKYVKQRVRYKAHDENNEYRTGDRVEIMEHRPLSKEKRWKVVRLIARPVLEERV